MMSPCCSVVLCHREVLQLYVVRFVLVLITVLQFVLLSSVLELIDMNPNTNSLGVTRCFIPFDLIISNLICIYAAGYGRGGTR